MDTLREVGGPGIVERYKTKRTAGLTASLGGMLNWHRLPPRPAPRPAPDRAAVVGAAGQKHP